MESSCNSEIHGSKAIQEPAQKSTQDFIELLQLQDLKCCPIIVGIETPTQSFFISI